MPEMLPWCIDLRARIGWPRRPSSWHVVVAVICCPAEVTHETRSRHRGRRSDGGDQPAVHTRRRETVAAHVSRSVLDVRPPALPRPPTALVRKTAERSTDNPIKCKKPFGNLFHAISPRPKIGREDQCPRPSMKRQSPSFSPRKP